MSLGVRLLEFIKNKGMSANRFALSMGYERSNNVRNLVSGRTGDTNATLLAEIVIHYPELNIIWLLTGNGNMLNEDIPKSHMVEEEQAEYKKSCANCTKLEGVIELLEKDKKDLMQRLEDMAKQIGRMENKN